MKSPEEKLEEIFSRMESEQKFPAGHSRENYNWNYDWLIDNSKHSILHMQNHNQSFYEAQRELRKISKSLKKKARQNRIRDPSQISKFKESFSGLEETIRINDSRINTMHDIINSLQKSHPFQIGPATLESLSQSEPEDYGYIEEGKVPFDRTFFDFYRDFSIGLPFEEQTNKALGIELHKLCLPETPGYLKPILPRYRAQIFTIHNDGERDYTMRVPLEFAIIDPEDGRKPFFFIQGSSASQGCFLYRDIEDIVYYSKEDIPPQSEIWMPESYPYSAPIKEVPNGDKFLEVPKFLINVINYINAHNVHIVPGGDSSEGKIPIRRDYSLKERSIIQLRDGEIRDSRSTGNGDPLQYRISVRGHNRHYRNDDGSLKQVIWIPPHIRGPIESPWLNQRHQVFGEKIEHERRLKNYGVKLNE